MMKWFLITVLLTMSSTASFAQLNFVRNGDFETYHSCPTGVDQIRIALGWKPIDTLTVNSDSSGNHYCSADYCNECSPTVPNGVSIPRNYFGYQYAHSGKGMGALAVYTDLDTGQAGYYMRDYIQNRLVRKLSAGQQYCVSFYVSLAENSDWGIKEIGAYFDNGAIDATARCGMPQSQYMPQVVNTSVPITDTMGWTKIEGSFTAAGTEQFITIGNFRGINNTTILPIPFNGKNGANISYYYIDDVSVVESNTVADAGPDKRIGRGDSVYIGRPMSSAIWCDWRVSGAAAIIGQGPGIWVKPALTTSYVVTQTLCGVITKDTVKVEVWAAGIGSMGNMTGQQYALLPNPNDGDMQLIQMLPDDQPVAITVFNAIGQSIYSDRKVFGKSKATLKLPSISPGLYHVVLRDSVGNTYSLKFVKK